jgi:PBSX family phage terminase large subunit
MNQNYKNTDKQDEAVNILASDASDICLFGGSRSGKSFILCRSIFIRAAKVKSRHAILRLNFNHAKRSLWLDTIPKVLMLSLPGLRAHPNKSDYFYTLPNGSEVWLGGLDDKDRIEKILGTEYSTMWFNECSQIDYSSILLAKTRLAEKNELKKKIYYDMNPPKKTHWTYWLFQKKLDPIKEETLSDPESYNSFLMNPKDNLENIDENYLKLLKSMPDKERERFMEGLFSDENDGSVYYAFNREKHVQNISKRDGTIFIGMDFNVDPMTATLMNFIDNKLWIFDEIFLENSDTYKMCNELKRKGYEGCRVIPDSTCKSRKTSGVSDFQILKEFGFYIEETFNPFVTDRINNVNRLFTDDSIIINMSCKKLINDFEKVSWKNNGLDQSGTNKYLTHISDTVGYAAWKLLPIMKRNSQRTVQL